MLKRQPKTDTAQHQGPERILVVDDNPDAARLLGKLFRRVGYEVAEVSDHQVALITLMNEPTPISAVVVSFSTAGNGACLKLLDAVRHTPEPRVNTQRMILVLESARQQLFTWQSGADEIVLRPYRSEDLLAATEEAIGRPDAERQPYRRQQVEALRAGVPEDDDDYASSAATFN